MEKTWKPMVAGILIFIAALTSGVTFTIAKSLGVPPVLTTIILVVLPAISGLGAIKRKWWNWTLAGAICSILSMPLFGIPAIILLAKAKHEFYSG